MNRLIGMVGIVAVAAARMACGGEAGTEIEAGATRVVGVAIAHESAVKGGEMTAVVSGDAVEIIGPARVSPGAERAFVRVRGLKAGTARVAVGGASVDVRVVSAGSASPTASIIGPTAEAVVWGKIAVGVEVPQGAGDGAIQVRVISGGKTVVAEGPLWSTGPSQGPLKRAAFEVDFDAVEEGRATLIASVDGRDGEPVGVRVVHPRAEDVIGGEAETRYDGERPKRFPRGRSTIGTDPEASGGKYFSNASSEPAFCFPIRVESAGLYQVVLTCGGNLAGGALPTVSLVLDGGDYGATNARLVSEKWQRIALGVPVKLKEGARWLTPYFENDFYVPGIADRNLKIDRIDVVRVGDAPEGPGGTMPGMMSMMGRRMGKGEDPLGLGAAALRVAWETPLEGLPLPGEMEVRGRCWWQGQEGKAAAPTVTLMLNGEAVGVQKAAAPRFVVQAQTFKAGANTLQLVASLESGVTARTPVQTMTWTGPATTLRARRVERYGVHDPRWDDATRNSLKPAKNAEEIRPANLASNGALVLTLPEDMAGKFEVFTEVAGDSFQGPAIARVSVTSAVTGAEPKMLGEVKAEGWFATQKAGEVEFNAGPKSVTVAFINANDGKGLGDRNLYVQAVILREIGIGDDTTAPNVSIVYPARGQPTTAFMNDAIIVDVADDVGVTHVDMLVDGVDFGMARWIDRQSGRVLLPLLTRYLEPGNHEVIARAHDAAGNTTLSEPRVFNVVAKAPAGGTKFERAVKLLDRFAYGPDDMELAAVLSMGEEPWLRDRLSRGPEDAGNMAALGEGVKWFANSRSEYEVQGRTLTEAIMTTNPARARFVLWLENHFSTWIRKVEGERQWEQHITFMRKGAAPFADLLMSSAMSPAMLRYLDQEESYVGRLNENYAREIMELHTLGVHGGYSQADVTSLAHLLTGWTTAREGDGRSGGEIRNWDFRFDPALNDGGEITLLGMTLPKADRADRYDRVRYAVELLAAHPSTAKFVCTKLAAHYTHAQPDESLVRDLTAVFESTGGDMKEVLLALAKHPLFWSDSRPRVAHPLDYCVRLMRVNHNFNPWMCNDYLQRSGAGLYDRATPDGYPETDAADSNAMVQRWRLPVELRWKLHEAAPWSLQAPEAVKDPLWAQRVVDSLSVRLTGRVLGDASNKAAIEMLDASKGTPQERIVAAAAFVGQMPEASLR